MVILDLGFTGGFFVSRHPNVFPCGTVLARWARFLTNSVSIVDGEAVSG